MDWKELLNPQGRWPPVVDPGPSEYEGMRNYRMAMFDEAPGRVIIPKSTRRGSYISFSNRVKLTDRRVDVDYAMGHSLSRPYWRSVWSRVLLRNQSRNSSCFFFWVQRFFTVFTIAGFFASPWVRSLQFTLSQQIAWNWILVLHSHLCPGFPDGLFGDSAFRIVPHVPCISSISSPE